MGEVLRQSADFFGFQFVGKDEAVTGRFYEMLVAEGGQLFTDDWEPAFNSERGGSARSTSLSISTSPVPCRWASELSLGRHRSRLRLRHGRDEPRLGGLVGLFQRSREQPGRGRPPPPPRGPCPGTQGQRGQSHRLVGVAHVLDHRDM